MKTEFVPVTPAEVAALSDLSITTFWDTYQDTSAHDDLQAYFDENLSEAQLKDELNQPHAIFFWIMAGSKVAGFLKLNTNDSQSEDFGDEYLEVERIYILPDFKRQGLGRRAIEFAESEAYQLGKHFIWLGVWEGNHHAQRFYEKMGFLPFSEHTFQVGSDPQRDILLKKEL
ncbi:GNAT family N-acetyltransferase [Lactobacillaceae bacterium L1_55_11]|nr:GNAT family N-acetyltransferase [Lactobacillaceae bacterium L1_55_11]